MNVLLRVAKTRMQAVVKSLSDGDWLGKGGRRERRKQHSKSSDEKEDISRHQTSLATTRLVMEDRRERALQP